MLEELPALRPWMFRVAHNAAIDFTRRHQHSHVELFAELPEPSDERDEVIEPDAVRTALATFLTLPPLQRSTVILKDVIGYTAAEIATMLGTTVLAVKAALVRGRKRLRDERARPDALTTRAPDPTEGAALEHYVRLFNAGDSDGLRALLAEDVRLDLVSIATRKGKAVGAYFGRYAGVSDVRLASVCSRTATCCGPWRPRMRSTRSTSSSSSEARRASRTSVTIDVPYIASELALAPHELG